MRTISLKNRAPSQVSTSLRLKTPILLYHFSLISEGCVAQAFLLPRFLPLLTSLREAQQQVRHSVISHAMIAKPDAIHMKANICVPRLALMFSSVTDVMASFMMMNIAVAIIVATVVQSAPRKVRIMMKSVAQRVNTEMGTVKIITKFRQMPVMKRPNIQWETTRISLSSLLISDGRATAHPVSRRFAYADCIHPLLTRSSRQELVGYDFHRIKPVEGTWRRAIGRALPIVSLAKIP